MNRLPVEILREIFQSLDVPSIKNCRLMNTLLADVGAEYLIPEAHLIFTKSSFQRLKEISLHPILSKHVKAFLYECDVFSVYLNVEDWIHSNKSSDYDTRAMVGAPNFHKQIEAWHAERNLFCEQQDILCDNLDLKEIQQAIARFPKLSAVCLRVNSALSGPVEYRPSQYLRDAYTGTLLKDRNMSALPNYIRTRGYRQCISTLLAFSNVQTNKIRPSDDQPSHHLRPAEAAKMEALELRSISCCVFYTQMTPSLRSAIGGLRDVKVVLNTGREASFEMEWSVQMMRSGGLKRFLSAVPNLEVLHVDFEFDLDRRTSRHEFALSRIVGTFGEQHHWLHLKDITFCHVYTESAELLGFLDLHQRSLERISLGHVDIDTNYARFLLAVRNVKEWKSVEMCHEFAHSRDGTTGLGDYFGDPRAQAIQENIWLFATRQNARNPLIYNARRNAMTQQELEKYDAVGASSIGPRLSPVPKRELEVVAMVEYYEGAYYGTEPKEDSIRQDEDTVQGEGTPAR